MNDDHVAVDLTGAGFATKLSYGVDEMEDATGMAVGEHPAVQVHRTWGAERNVARLDVGPTFAELRTTRVPLRLRRC